MPSVGISKQEVYCSSYYITAVETTHLLAASGPEASVQDINYGGGLTDDIDDQ